MYRRCHTAHTYPMIKLTPSAPHRFCIGSIAYPNQPPLFTEGAKELGARTTGIISSLTEAKYWAQVRDSQHYQIRENIIIGIKRTIDKFHLLIPLWHTKMFVSYFLIRESYLSYVIKIIVMLVTHYQRSFYLSNRMVIIIIISCAP